jgi:hypothetical protein
MDKVVTIQAQEYQRLLERDLDLQYLEDSGVDNWSGYGEGETRGEADDTLIRAKVDKVAASSAELTTHELQMLLLSRAFLAFVQEECPGARLSGYTIMPLWNGWRLNMNGIRPDGGMMRVVLTPDVPADADYDAVVAKLIADLQTAEGGK